MDCPTIQANDARDLTRSGRVTLDRPEVGGTVPEGIYLVAVDGVEVGCVVRASLGWFGARDGWHDPHPRSKRATAVRRLLMSHPRGTFDRPPAATVVGEHDRGGTDT